MRRPAGFSGTREAGAARVQRSFIPVNNDLKYVGTEDDDIVRFKLSH